MGIKGTSKRAGAASQLCKVLGRHRNALGHEPSASINEGLEGNGLGQGKKRKYIGLCLGKFYRAT